MITKIGRWSLNEYKRLGRSHVFYAATERGRGAVVQSRAFAFL